jgi:hypothetical protein
MHKRIDRSGCVGLQDRKYELGKIKMGGKNGAQSW